MFLQAGPAALKIVLSTFTQLCLSGTMILTWTRALKGVRLHALVRQRIQLSFVAYLQLNRDGRPPRDILCRHREQFAIFDLLDHLYKKDTGNTCSPPYTIREFINTSPRKIWC